MPTSSYSKRTEQNVIDSDGTLIISHGKLIGGSALTKEFADEYGCPCLHIDLDVTDPFAAVKAINYWLSRHKIETLNVAGPRLSKDPRIYKDTKKVLLSVTRLS